MFSVVSQGGVTSNIKKIQVIRVAVVPRISRIDTIFDESELGKDGELKKRRRKSSKSFLEDYICKVL